jgi:hypothetical protein
MMAKYHQRKRQAGTAAFVFLVLVADLLGMYLTFFYSSTVIVWFFFLLRFCGTSVLAFFYHDMLTTLGLGALLATGIIALSTTAALM